MNQTQENLKYFICRKTLFCGCQQITQYQQSISILSNDNNYADFIFQIPFKVYFCVCIIFIISALSLRFSTRWFIFKDYYPMKERSPLLCNILIGILSIQIQLYPILYIYNYFTETFTDTQVGYRVCWHALRGGTYFVYFLRSMRISYSHDVDVSRSKTVIFRIFKQQSILAAIVIGMISLRAILILITYYFEDDNPVYTPIELNSGFRYNDQINLLMGTALHDFAWQIALIYSYWLQFRVNPRYSMKNQLLVVISSNLILSIISWFYIIFSDSSSPPLMTLCFAEQFYPIIEIYDIVGLLTMAGISIVHPLFKKKVYHVLLPTGIHYGLMKTMRDFLMEQQFMQVFSAYLKNHDQEMDTKYFQVLQLWKKIMVLKFCSKQSQIEKLEQLKILLDSLQKILFQKHQKLIINLKGSIAGLQQSISISNEQTDRYIESINEKLNELQQITLQKLDKIYKEQYQKTKSYNFLKYKIKEYKRINVNMILLNLAIFTDAVDD